MASRLEDPSIALRTLSPMAQTAIDLGDMTSDQEAQDENSEGQPAEDKWWTILRDKVLHPHFLLLMACGGLPQPGDCSVNRSLGKRIYKSFLSVFFIGCLVVCASRIVFHSAPAYYNVWTNLAFVMLHMWVPFAHRAVSSLLQFKPLKDAQGGVPDLSVEDENARSSLQAFLVELIQGLTDAKKALAEAVDVADAGKRNSNSARNRRGSVAALQDSEVEIRRKEVLTYENEFASLRKATGLVAHVALAFGIVAVAIVFFGWIFFDFFSDVYHDSNVENYKSNSLERLWFGYVSGGAFAIIVVPWVAALMAVYGMIRTLCTIAKARVRIFAFSCQRAFDKAVVILESEAPAAIGLDHLANASGQASTRPNDLGGGRKRSDSRKSLVRQRFQNLTASAAAFGLSEEFVHRDVAFSEMQCAAATLRNEIQLACKEWDVLLSALIMVCAALIVLPIINFTAAGAGNADDDGSGFQMLEGTNIHYYLRDIFNLTVGVVAIFLALMETASLTNECEKAIEMIFTLHKDHPFVPPLKGHQALREYVCSPQYAKRFGFTIMGVKIINKHLITFCYGMICVISAVGGKVASANAAQQGS